MACICPGLSWFMPLGGTLTLPKTLWFRHYIICASYHQTMVIIIIIKYHFRYKQCRS